MLVKIPNKVLSKKAKPVKKIDKKILKIIKDLKKTLVNADKPKGVGLAAPQIGLSLRIFIAKPTFNSPISVFINPEIIWRSKDLSAIKRPKNNKKNTQEEQKLEGCLSIPNVWGYLKRPTKIKLRYMNTKGKIQEKKFSGFMATIIQHEVDHLNGVLFTQRVLEQKEKLYTIKKDGKGKNSLVEIEV